MHTFMCTFMYTFMCTFYPHSHGDTRVSCRINIISRINAEQSDTMQVNVYKGISRALIPGHVDEREYQFPR